MRITDSRGEEGVGEFLDLGGRGAVGQVVGDGLDRLAAVEVGDVGGDRALDLQRGQQRRAGTLVAEAGADRLAVEADLRAVDSPSLAQALGGEVAVLGLAGRQGRDLHRPRRGALPRRLEDLGATGGEAPQLLVAEAARCRRCL